MSRLRYIDLNCDLGDADTPEQLDVESRVMAYVSSVNIACGLHAGTPDLMRRTIHLAKQHHLAIGAHPGFSDRGNYGRQDQSLIPSAVENLVAYQIGALCAMADLEQTRISHVKLHGSLYNMAARNRSLAEAVARAISAVDPQLILVGLANSELVRAGHEQGLHVAAEAFADRAYHEDGRLVPRESTGAVLEDERAVASQVQSLVVDRRITSAEGRALLIRADTLCLHADTPDAVHLAQAIRQTLTSAGVTVRRLDHGRA